MREAGIGRVLVASLHQAISDILPTRLGFYENWLSVEGLREGTIGLAPLYAVLSFLRQEGPYVGFPRPDILLLDLNMPKLDGLAVLRQIRSVDLKQPVIVLTGDTSPEREQEVRALGVSEFIIKGSSLQFLEDTLKHLLHPSVVRQNG